MSRVDTARENYSAANEEVIHWERGFTAALARRDQAEVALINAEAEDAA